jgi:hypothetical protein
MMASFSPGTLLGIITRALEREQQRNPTNDAERQAIPARTQALYGLSRQAQAVVRLESAVASGLADRADLDASMNGLTAAIAAYGQTQRRGDFDVEPQRTTVPVAGLYEDVGTASRHANWTFQDEFRDGGLTITTYVIDPQQRKGDVTRTFDPGSGQLLLGQAFLEDCGRWIPGVTPMNQKGIPTVTYVQIRQMKLWERALARNPALRQHVPKYPSRTLAGNLQEVKWSTITNVRTAMAIWAHMERGATLEQAFLASHSASYAETLLTQSHLQYVPGTLEVVVRDSRVLGKSMADPGEPFYREEQALMTELQKNVPKLGPSTVVPWEIDAKSKVRRIP